MSNSQVTEGKTLSFLFSAPLKRMMLNVNFSPKLRKDNMASVYFKGVQDSRAQLNYLPFNQSEIMENWRVEKQF